MVEIQRLDWKNRIGEMRYWMCTRRSILPREKHTSHHDSLKYSYVFITVERSNVSKNMFSVGKCQLKLFTWRRVIVRLLFYKVNLQ